MRNESGYRLAAAVVLLLVGLSTGFEASAGEMMIEAFSGKQKFTQVWPGGTIEQGGGSGMPWLRVVTEGDGNGVFVANVRPYKPTIDLSGKFVKLWLRLDQLTNLGGLELRLSSDRFAESYFAFGFPLFDDEDFNIVRDGVWTTITLGFAQARRQGNPSRSAINSIGLYVADTGKQAPVTLYWGGIAAVDEPSEGVLSFTFDDGYDEHLSAAEMMAVHGFRGTAYVIPDAVGQHEYMTLHQLVDLQERYGWDVAAHHQTPFTTMRPDELEDTILGVQRFLVDNEFYRGVGHLAYPLGKQNTSLVRPLVRKHFTTARVASHGFETLPPADPHLLRTLNVTTDTTPEQVGQAALRAKQNKEWLLLMFHWFVEDPQFETQYSIKGFVKLLEQVAQTGIRVAPVSEVWDACGRYRGTGGCQIGTALAAPSP